jgi:hypothetical protein
MGHPQCWATPQAVDRAGRGQILASSESESKGPRLRGPGSYSLEQHSLTISMGADPLF